MLTKKVKSRIFFLSISIVLAVLIIFIVLRYLEENVVYFFSPTEIYNKESISIDKNIRVGGLVKKDSPVFSAVNEQLAFFKSPKTLLI